MPSNIQHENISDAKLGIETISKGYIGHNEVYPNTREIQSAAYTSTSTLASGGGTRTFRVTGETGATYNLTGYGSGSYTLNSSPYDHSISIGANTSCGGSARTISTTLVPTGSTVLQGGGSNFPSSFTQSHNGYVSWAPNTITVSGSLTHTNPGSTIVTISGVNYFTPGANFTATLTVSGYQQSPNLSNYVRFIDISTGGLGGVQQNGSNTNNAAESAQSGSGVLNYSNGAWVSPNYPNAQNINGSYSINVTLGGITNFASIRYRLFNGSGRNTNDPCITSWNGIQVWSGYIYP